MKLGLYSIRDLKSNFAPPITISNNEVAKRWFGTRVNEDITMKFEPSDFDLYKVGEFDTETGEVMPIQKELLCNGKEFEK